MNREDRQGNITHSGQNHGVAAAVCLSLEELRLSLPHQMGCESETKLLGSPHAWVLESPALDFIPWLDEGCVPRLTGPNCGGRTAPHPTSRT